MSTPDSNTAELFTSFDEASDEVMQVLSSSSEEEINTIPFKDSWTACQVAEHIRKSVNSLVPYLQKEGKVTERKPDERANEFKDMFLSVDNKFNSPESILPGDGPFEKAGLIADLQNSFGNIKAEREKVNLSELIPVPAFGDTTKLELLHFVLYHTQRHLRQMKKVIAIVQTEVV